ncbi:MAG: adenylate/guanylate cyclase domain-containing protein [Magnetococcales bacterium]|nr:adenylate/guanylate cyclase domain-containing protein [Magnetococcales bacterium]
MTHRHPLRHIIGLLLLAGVLLHTLGILPWPFLDRLETLAYDVRVRLSAANTVDQRVVIVDLDEKSLANIGRWPWGRDKMADLVDNLFDHYRVGVVGFDVTFSEPDTSSGLPILEQLARGPLKNNDPFLTELRKIRPSLERDERLADSIEDRNIILGYYFRGSVHAGTHTFGQLPEPVITLDELGQHTIPFLKATGFGANLEMLQDVALGAGFFDNPLVDNDGFFRRVPLLQEYQGKLYQALSLAVIRAILGEPPLTLGINKTVGQQNRTIETGLAWIGLGPHHIPIDEQGAVFIPYRGGQGSFPYVSAVDVITKKADPLILQDAIVLIGTTAPGLKDLRSTPIQPLFPGVEIHANIISGMLDGLIKHTPGQYTLLVEVLILLIIGLMFGFISAKSSPALILYLALLMVLIVVSGNLFLWKNNDLILPLASPLFLTIGLFIWHFAYGFFVVSRGRRLIIEAFSHYVSPPRLEEMVRSDETFSLGGETRNMTVLLTDLRGFTTLSEEIEPEDLSRLMSAFLTPITETIQSHSGTIDKYMGDSVMAFWGAPMIDGHHARNSLLAAFDIVQNMELLKAEFQARGWPLLKIGIGINSGRMTVGNMGSQFRVAYTVMGDAVNLGFHMLGLTKQYGVLIIVGEETQKAVPEMLFRELDRVRVKGRVEPEILFEPVDFIHQITTDTQAQLASYHQALELYRNQQWDEAEKRFKNLQQRNPERMIYDIYLSRIQHFNTNPPEEDWDGVFSYFNR